MQPSCERLKQMWSANGSTEGQRGKPVATCSDASGKLGPSKECGFETKASRYTDLRATAKYIYRTEGALAFTKGVLPRMSINVPSTALSWGTYELVKSFLINP